MGYHAEWQERTLSILVKKLKTISYLRCLVIFHQCSGSKLTLIKSKSDLNIDKKILLRV